MQILAPNLERGVCGEKAAAQLCARVLLCPTRPHDRPLPLLFPPIHMPPHTPVWQDLGLGTPPGLPIPADRARCAQSSTCHLLDAYTSFKFEGLLPRAA